MDGDFGAGLDAALTARLGELRAAADAARARIDQGLEAIAAIPAAVPFDFPEDEFGAPADSEGIPFPEDNV